MGENAISLSPNARLVLEKRYLKKDTSGRTIESPEDMFMRIAKNVASADLIYNEKTNIASIEEQFYTLLTSLQFMPNSPALMNAGETCNNYLRVLSFQWKILLRVFSMQ